MRRAVILGGVRTLVHEMRRRAARTGLAALCVGLGPGQAALFESTDGANER